MKIVRLVAELDDGTEVIVKGVTLNYKHRLNYDGRDIPDSQRRKWVDHEITWSTDHELIRKSSDNKEIVE